MHFTNANARSRGAAVLRKGRISLPNHVYHVTTVTTQRIPLFRDHTLGRIVVQALMQEAQRHQVLTVAYVVMPDHLHWLMRLPDGRTLAQSVGAVKSVSARRINKRIGSRTAVWCRNYFDRAVRRDEDLIEIARYIVANPLRAKIVNSIRKYSLWDAVWVDDKFML